MRITIGLILITSICGFSQQSKPQVSDTVEISFLYNVTILFDSPLVGKPYFGSRTAIIEEIIDEKTLMVKVDGQQMLNLESSKIPNTNMLVKTKTGIYNFILTYKKTPSRTFISPGDYTPIHVYSNVVNEETKIQKTMRSDSLEIMNTLQKLNASKQYFSDLGLIDSKLRMKMQITNIWVDSLYIHFKIYIENSSSIPYDINYFHYVTTFGKFNIKRASDPINEKRPKFQLINPKGVTIPGGKSFSNIVSFEKFTLNKNEFFNIQVGEINGARQISVPVSRKELFESKSVFEVKNE
jgi:hypothetical protein